jgi:hypothetical protein
MYYSDAQIKDIILRQLYMEDKPMLVVRQIFKHYEITIELKRAEGILRLLEARDLIYVQTKHQDWQIGLLDGGAIFCEITSFQNLKRPIIS